MAGSEHSKSKPLFIMKLLYERSDDERGVTMAEIISYLEAQGVTAERKSVYRDLHMLKECGIEIEKNCQKPVEYCLMNRAFDIAELRLLADAVQSANFISEAMTKNLLEKIEKLASSRSAGILRRQIHFAGRVKTQNEHVHYATATIQESIHEGLRIHFKYIDYDLSKGIQPRRGGSLYEVSPYALVWNDDNYYLIGYYERREQISVFRVDRMKTVDKTDIPSAPTPPGFSLSDYIETKFGMFGGERVSLDLRFSNDLINPVLDRFGMKTPIIRDGDDRFIAHVEASISPVFFSWLFQFGSRAQIMKPKRIAEDYADYLSGTLESMRSFAE